MIRLTKILKHLCLTCAIIISITIRSQNNDRWNAGSAKQLTGKTVSMICFISTQDCNWTMQEKDRVLSGISETEEWIIREAEKYNIDLSMHHVVLNPENDIIFDTIEPGLASGNERVDWGLSRNAKERL